MSMPGENTDLVIRVAIDIDLMQLVKLAQDYVDEADRWTCLTFDPDRAVMYGAISIDDPNQQIFVASVNGKLVGFMWGAIMGQVWTSDPIAQDLFLFVHPDHRNFSVGKGLVKAFEEWAVACGAKAIHTGANSGVLGDKAASLLYSSLGYESGGANFFKHLT